MGKVLKVWFQISKKFKTKIFKIKRGYFDHFLFFRAILVTKLKNGYVS